MSEYKLIIDVTGTDTGTHLECSTATTIDVKGLNIAAAMMAAAINATAMLMDEITKDLDEEGALIFRRAMLIKAMEGGYEDRVKDMLAKLNLN